MPAELTLEQRVHGLEQTVSELQLAFLSGTYGVNASPTNTTRTLTDPFTIGGSRIVYVSYIVQLEIQPGLVTPDSASVQLLENGVSIDEAYLYGNQLLGLFSVGQQTKERHKVSGFVSPTSTISFSTTGTASMISCSELVFGVQ